MKELNIAFVLFLLPLFLIAQDKMEYSVLLIPENLTKGANTVIRGDIGKFVVHNHRTATETRRMVLTRLNKKAILKTLRVPYDMYSKVTKLKVYLYDANGKLIRKIKKDEIHDNASFDGVSIYSDNRYKSVDLSYGTYPYTIEYEYVLEHKGIFGLPGEYALSSYKTSVQNWEYTVKTPIGFEYDSRAYNFDPMVEDLSKEEFKMIEFSAQNIQPIKSEYYAPSPVNIFPLIRFKSALFGVDDYEGSMADWQSYGIFMYQLNAKHNNLSEEMKREIKAMTQDAETNAEKIDILYRYVQENMRYVSVQLGIGGWKSFDAAYVEKNKYGDCKALTWFMKSMLETIGIEAYPALVMAGEEHCRTSQSADFCSPSFNHVILNVPSEETWLECTSNFNPTNYLGSFTDDRMVMLITEKGGELVQTPAIPIEKNKAFRETAIKLNVDGSAFIKNSSLLTGPKHEDYRYLSQLYSQEELEKWFLKSTSLPSCTIQELSLQVEKEHPTALLNYTVEVPKYGSKGGKRLFIAANCIGTFDDVPDATDERNHPVFIGRGYMDEDKITLQLPEGYQVESIPNETLEFSSEFGMYDLKIEKEEGKIIYHRTLKIMPVDLPAERYDELRNFYKKIAKADKMKLVLVEKKT